MNQDHRDNDWSQQPGGYDGWTQDDGGHDGWGGGHGGYARTVSQVGTDERVAFIRRTYAHLAGAIALFVGIEGALFAAGIPAKIVPLMASSGYSWLVVLGLFMVVGMIADKWARSPRSKPMQYAGLGLYVVAQALIFTPMMAYAMLAAPTAIPTAAVVTLIVFGGLTAVVFITKQDFSFLRLGLMVAGFLALGGIVAATFFTGLNLGFWFSLFMVGLASGYILYYTSNVLHHYQTNQHVAAALALFSAVALLFWYILRIFMASD